MIKPTEKINWTVVVWSGLLRPSKRNNKEPTRSADVFKVPLENIVESVTYSTREKSEVFVETIKKSMHSEIKMDSIAYLVSEGNPLDENGKLWIKNLYVLGGTHYLAALKKINEEKQMVEINAVIFKDLSDEETLG
ncbi:hypothetical protein OS493_019070 [Desmophyllum pertusum]|uniref:Uncharacterized protein n=1 Tax=Desmophyllum pertusum TaxID=174260 RepID=A0A9W9YZL6_9CNID|nr:hypothetical protein OS493_019070 [Desmophyllum pertusum]